MPFLFQILFICLTDKIKLDFSKILVYNKLVPNEGAKLVSQQSLKKFSKKFEKPLDKLQKICYTNDVPKRETK